MKNYSVKIISYALTTAILGLALQTKAQGIHPIDESEPAFYQRMTLRQLKRSAEAKLDHKIVIGSVIDRTPKQRQMFLEDLNRALDESADLVKSVKTSDVGEILLYDREMMASFGHTYRNFAYVTDDIHRMASFFRTLPRRPVYKDYTKFQTYLSQIQDNPFNYRFKYEYIEDQIPRLAQSIREILGNEYAVDHTADMTLLLPTNSPPHRHQNFSASYFFKSVTHGASFRASSITRSNCFLSFL